MGTTEAPMTTEDPTTTTTTETPTTTTSEAPMTTTTTTEAGPEPSTTGAATGESSTLYPPLVPCPFECPAESGYFEVEPCGPFYCSCTNFDGYLQECPEGLVWHTEDEFGYGECDYPFNDPDCAE